MTLTHVAPYFVLSALFLLVAGLIVKYIDFFRQAVQQSEKVRYPTLDGLRGFLALGVFFNHTIDLHQYFQTGEVNYPGATFYAFLGDGAVALFFMITGFLFWSKAIAGDKINLKKFYWARFWRIYPVYWLSLLLMISIVLIMAGFSLRENGFSSIYKTIVWMTCGVFSFPFIKGIDFVRFFPAINGFDPAIINSGICWTLAYELQFYLIFPLLVFLVKPLRFLALFVVMLLVYRFLPNAQTPLILCFLFGMLTAYLVHHFPLQKIFQHWGFSVVAFLLLGGVPIVLQKSFQPGTFPLPFTLAAFIVFVILVYGNSLFGLLTTAASRYLGKVSYDIYLLHGIVLFSVLGLFNQFYSVKLLNPIGYWSLAGISGLIVIGISGLAHRYVEDPMMRMKTLPSALTKAFDWLPSKKP